MAVHRLDPSYVLAPLDALLANCHSNVVLGLRLVQQIDDFPPPTSDELQFMQLSFGGRPDDLVASRKRFQRWILLNGFEDVHMALRDTLERLIVWKRLQRTAQANETTADERERSLRAEVSRLHFPQLLAQAAAYFPTGLTYQSHAESFNAARNCLQHTHGIVTERHCTDGRLIVRGRRFKLYFKKEGEEIPAVMGHAGPEGAALMLGAEEFQLKFDVGESIELTLKQFLDVLNTCIFVRAEVSEFLNSQ